MAGAIDASISPKRARLLWAAVFAVGAFMVFFRIGNDALWYDESYSAAAVRHPLTDTIAMIGKDSHPPLYFIILKAVVLAFGDSPAALRTASALGILGLASMGFWPLRRICGERTGLVFSLMALLTPMSIASAHEARMYSWAAFLVTGMVLFGYLAATEGRKRDWFLAGLFTLAAAYTHYYALIAAGMYWLFLLARILISRDRKALVRWSISAIILLALYSPWIGFLAGQAARVKKSYWIPPTDLGMVLRTVGYPFDRKFRGVPDAGKVGIFIAVLAAGVSAAVVLFRRKDRRWFLPFSALAVYTSTLLAAILLSKVFRPILMERYMLSCMGLLLLGAAVLAGSWKRPWIMPTALGLFLAMTLPTLVSVYGTEVNGAMDLVYADLKDEVGPNDVFIHGSEHNMGTFSYYFPKNRHYLYLPEGYVPLSNYDVFSDRGGYGSDLGVFDDEPATIWATAHDGQYYFMPFDSIAKGPLHRSSEDARWYFKSPGWYSVCVQKIEYIPPGSEAEPAKGE